MAREKKSAKQKMREGNRKFADKVREYAISHAAPEEDMAMFADMLGSGRHSSTMLASDLELRRKSSSFLGQALEALRFENPGLQFHFWTLIHARGNTSDREPKVELKFLRSLVDRTLRSCDLDGLYILETQGLGNHPRNGEGRTIMVHAHAITWSTARFDAARVERELSRSDAWRSGVGAPPVIIKPVGNEPGELAYIAYYLFKAPYDVKMLEKGPHGDRLRPTEKGYRPEFAVRLVELLSQLGLTELVRAIGRGKAIRTQWLRRLTNWHRSREKWVEGRLPPFYFDSFWDRYRVKKKQKTYCRFRIIR